MIVQFVKVDPLHLYDSDDDDFNDFPRDRGAHHFDVDTSALYTPVRYVMGTVTVRPSTGHRTVQSVRHP